MKLKKKLMNFIKLVRNDFAQKIVVFLLFFLFNSRY